MLFLKYLVVGCLFLSPVGCIAWNNAAPPGFLQGHLVTTRLGLQGSSASYVCRYLGGQSSLPPTVSLDHVAKVAAKIEKMGEHKLTPRKKVNRVAPQSHMLRNTFAV
jgi:hypothetical protein